MRHLAMLGCLGFLAFSISAAPLPDSLHPVPGANAARPAHLIDRDGDRISDGLQATIGSARAGDLLRVIVTYSGPGNAAAARQAVGFFVLHHEFKIINGFSATMTAAQIRALAQRAGVFRIEEDFPVSAKLDAARSDFGADAARTSFGVSGAGIKGCIVDTGVDPSHEQLNNVPIPFFDATNLNYLGAAYDDNGHGTHVASIAFGDGTGGSGADKYKGVAPGVSIHAAKVLDQAGSGLESQVIAGIDWCVAQGAHIISMSLGSDAPSDGSDALSQAANAAVANGRVVVAAAGNSGDEPGTVGSPGAAALVITVAACAERSAPAGSPNHSDGMYLTHFSSRGPTLDNRVKPDVCAPGHSITAAKAGTVGGYVTYSGTSMATPFVAGMVALALQGHPMSPAQVRQNLESTAQDRGPDGKDNDWGAGLVDAYAYVAKTRGISGYVPTAFPAHQRISASVANHGLWTYPFSIGPADLGIPIGATITIDGQAKCTLPLLGTCFAAQWDPDLEARLIAPNGVLLADSTCLADDECGGIGRQETLHAMPTVAGTYTIQVYPAEDSGNLGKGGSFFLDLSTGPLAGVASNPNPVAHVGDLDASTTGGRSGWKATITITLHDANHALLTSGATVSGSWSGGYSGSSSCTTGASGQCSVTSGNISKRKASATFTITNVIGALTYQSGGNHDPDPSDSNGTLITVSRP
ncbi:MAG TPA: S8 family serine peptidase [Ramlibacter sp.]|nr:S8 family serine peptidase [Ramlibacter sp.]